MKNDACRLNSIRNGVMHRHDTTRARAAASPAPASVAIAIHATRAPPRILSMATGNGDRQAGAAPRRLVWRSVAQRTRFRTLVRLAARP